MYTLEEQAVLEVTQRLSADGWTQTDYEEPAFAIQGTADVFFQVSLNQTAKDYGVAFFPSLGVRHVETSRLVAQFKGLQPSAGEGVASFGCGLADLLYLHGYEMAPFKRWLIRDSGAIDAVVTLLCEDLETYAAPFFRSLSTLGAIIDRIEQEKRHQAQSGHLAVANALAGRTSQALDALSEYAEAARSQRPPMSTQSWGFIESFIDYFRVDRSSLPFELGSR
ncbi:hypothetical protein [Streptomyces sp. UNOC14_S4]|uniref:hypothetical protein n=1 Tax=Streptomyces sp. UNOC14_S4 TaxID=2872340 RepID=UPI001E32552E|nr:hypothetical protein [Streptomyces sp. UNOC14_S4]MCC3767758.1 hypothetical protein [Streptomyces sp. UNOC14_S4]